VQQTDRLQALLPLLRCPRCGAHDWAIRDETPRVLRCDACFTPYPFRDGVLHLSELEEDRAVQSERAAVTRTERTPELGGISDAFDDLARANGEIKDAILALPYGNGSKYYEEPGYFANVRASARAFDFVVDRLDGRAGGMLLDLGADLTWSTARLAERGFTCVAVDINHHLPVATMFQERCPPYALINVDMHAPAFADASFDVITAFNALHHSHRLERLASNLGRMLKPGGRLGFVEPYCLDAEAKARFGAAHIMAGVNENVYLLEEWHQALTAAGLVNLTFLLTDSFNAIYEKSIRGVSPQARLDEARGDLFARYHRARLSVNSQSARSVGPSESLRVAVQVTNHGRASWCSEGALPVYLSYHLFRVDQSGQPSLITYDNPRTPLPGIVGPDDAVEIMLPIVAPHEPGRYAAEIDLVQEGECWFAERGVRSPRVQFQVV